MMSKTNQLLQQKKKEQDENQLAEITAKVDADFEKKKALKKKKQKQQKKI